jgi:hypothetical protein
MIRNKPTRRPRNIETSNYHYDRVAIVSTAHLCEEDGKLILHLDAPGLRYVGAQGASSMFKVPRLGVDALENAFKEWEKFGFSPGFYALVSELAGMDFQYVCFDRDGPIYPQFKEFDW